MFEPLPERDTVVSSCADVLRRAIVRGELAPGQRLPPERLLSERFGVNRTTLRAALRELSADGLLSVRQGSGYTVRDFRSEGGADLVPVLLDLARERGQLRASSAELLRVRRHLAGALIERLAESPPAPSALDELERSIDAMEAALLSDLATIVQADLAVVSALVTAAGSDVLAVMISPIGRILAALPELAKAIYAEPKSNIAAWRLLLQALRAGALSGAPWSEALRERDRATLARLEPR